MKITTHLDRMSHCKVHMVRIGRMDRPAKYASKILTVINSLVGAQVSPVGERGQHVTDFLVTFEPRSILNPHPQTRNPRPETRDPKPETRNPKPKIRNPEPETKSPKPQTQNPKPCTVTPNSSTLTPQPSPHTLNLKP